VRLRWLLHLKDPKSTILNLLLLLPQQLEQRLHKLAAAALPLLAVVAAQLLFQFLALVSARFIF
jgi:hypothetical protein